MLLHLRLKLELLEHFLPLLYHHLPKEPFHLLQLGQVQDVRLAQVQDVRQIA
jgi:hypothetical protein